MMGGLVCFLANSAMLGMYRKAHRDFRYIRDVEKVQQEKLLGILARNAGTDFGRAHGFAKIRDMEGYRERVPLRDYGDFEPWLARIRAGEQNVLTAEKVLLLEPTSGSTSGTKLIPYTQGLREEFQQGLKPWIYDLYTAPGLEGMRWGKSYWSVTPAATGRRRTQGGVPIGFEEDRAYFGRLEQWLLGLVLAAPGSLGREEDMDAFLGRTARTLAGSGNLTFLSVWNPTYLELLLDRVEAEGLGSPQTLWKRLAAVSCWADAQAAGPARSLKERLPGVAFQPKGLLATEGFVSFPVWGERGAALSVRSHFFEFELEDGSVLPAHRLERGCRGSVVLTTSGGLYRYRLKDEVEVTGFLGRIPLLRFLGRKGRVSDLFGEKLAEGFVGEVLGRLDLPQGLAFLAPEGDRYVLYSGGSPDPEVLDMALRENFHYDYCRRLGQLKAPAVYRLERDAAREYLEACVARGQRLGDVKPPLLQLEGGWHKVLKGGFL
ncbi:GH3 family domain-containing protein [Anaerotalea alkaliphila]|uniref:GH3 auxin-responsive promoter family protein n=1 Tax=Anaerotalea alkaliphila TaxID=2662126 RepID=A0A7X5KN76_9FIRM|nr:GH3 auxin-responsive promoter family protein [Anaerotalea alkaliphila]NDL68569.1 GH3 auxin-responsive promoter family protein [Anaerotalea alkaliphila]